MILGDIELHTWASEGGIIPYDPDLVNPASVNLRIGSHYRSPDTSCWGELQPIPPQGLIITRHEFYLLHTMEIISMPLDRSGKLFLRSSAARKGYEHSHATYIDPGFEGQVTLEVTNISPWKLRLKEGDAFIQLVLYKVTKVATPYGVRGHYQHQMGPTVPWEWKNDGRIPPHIS